MSQPAQSSRTNARALRCDQCGGLFDVDRIAAVLPCPYCHGQVAVTATVLADLRQHEIQVRGRLERAMVDLEEAERITEVEPLRITGLPWMLLGGGSLLMALYFLGVEIPAGWRKTWAELLFGPAVRYSVSGALALVSAIGFGLWWRVMKRGRRPARQRSFGSVRVDCPNCGAPAGFDLGRAGGDCSHCGAHLVPGDPQLDAAVAQASDIAWRAQIRRWRAERRRASGGAVAQLFGSFEGMEREEASPYDQAFERLGKQLGQPRFRSLEKKLGWLNRYWLWQFPQPYVLIDWVYGGISCSLGELPCMIDVQLPRPPEKDGGARLMDGVDHVFIVVAAWLPGLSDGSCQLLDWPAATRPQVDELERRGWSVSASRGGLIASANLELFGCMYAYRDLSFIVDALPLLEQLATRLGAQPPPEVPDEDAGRPVNDLERAGRKLFGWLERREGIESAQHQA